jgi:hypothetical protein
MISPAQPTAAFSGPATRKRRNGRGEEKRERQTERSTCSIGSGGGWRMARKTKAIRSRRGDAGEDQWECHLGWHRNGRRADDCRQENDGGYRARDLGGGGETAHRRLIDGASAHDRDHCGARYESPEQARQQQPVARAARAQGNVGRALHHNEPPNRGRVQRMIRAQPHGSGTSGNTISPHAGGPPWISRSDRVSRTSMSVATIMLLIAGTQFWQGAQAFHAMYQFL